jgi:hypothetical protein
VKHPFKETNAPAAHSASDGSMERSLDSWRLPDGQTLAEYAFRRGFPRWSPHVALAAESEEGSPPALR